MAEPYPTGDVPGMPTGMDLLKKLVTCGSCGRNRIDEALCSSCLLEDIKIISEWHQQGEMSNSDGSWDICLRCHDGWPCDAVKAIMRVRELEEQLAKLQ